MVKAGGGKASIGLVALAALLLSVSAEATVFINEVFINPPASTDSVYEFIEFGGTPGMKLDGYAVAVLNGTEQKYYPLDSIYLPDNLPVPTPEIDEFFSLDGLTLGSKSGRSDAWV